MNKVKEVIEKYKDEELLKWIIEQKIERYIKARRIEEEKGVIMSKVTELEDSIARAIEMYMALKEKKAAIEEQEEKVQAIIKRLEAMVNAET